MHKDIYNTNINNIKSKHSSNDDSAHSNNVNKTVNVKRKSANLEKEIRNSSLKKQKCFNDVSCNENTTTVCKSSENIKRKRIQQIMLDYKTEIQRRSTRQKSPKKSVLECDICFRSFSCVRTCQFHKQYYGFNDVLCKICKKHFASQDKLLTHMFHKHKGKPTGKDNGYKYKCVFCSRKNFKNKLTLQSHLYHTHCELIHFNDTIKRETSISKNINTSSEDDTLETSRNRKANKESHSNNLREGNFKSEKLNTTLTSNVNKSWDDNVMGTEKSLNNETSPTKRLRQPMLTEYFEPSKKKHDINVISPNKLDTMKDDFPAYTSHQDEQIEGKSKPQRSERHNNQTDSLSTKSDNLPKQMAQSIPEQTTVKHEIDSAKKPFVRLHADVEMMKSFLENLSDTIEDKVTEDRISDDGSFNREIPYSLRSLNGIPSVEAGSNPGRRKTRSTSKTSQVNMEFSIGRKQIVNKVDPKVDWKIIMAHFKCKECTIPLTRCDEQPRSSYQISTIDAMENTSLTPQRNSTLLQESDTPNKMRYKNLEVSLERLTVVSPADTKTELDAEKHNSNYLCKVCEMSFPSKLDRRAHIKSSHIAYMSSICNARYTQKHKLLQHYLHEHLFKQDQCCICYMLLPDYEAVKQHLNIHCLKFLQKEDDQYPVDVELKCSQKCSTEKPPENLNCNKIFSSQSSLEAHSSCCVVQEEMEKDSVEEVSVHPKDIPETQHEKNTEPKEPETTAICDKRINPDLCEPLNSDGVEEKSKERRISLHNEKELDIEVNRNVLVNNNLTEKKIESVNKSQNSEKLLENNNSTVSNQLIAKMQLNDITTKTHPCDVCGKQFQNRKNLEVHIRTFSLTTDICPMCGTGFSSKRLLQTHITAAHVPHISNTYNFHCVFCNQGFFKKHDLRPHMLHLHRQQLLNMITRNFNMRQEKSDHSSVIHTAVCNVCKLVFENHDRYVEHRMYYYKNHTFTCSLCAIDFQGMYMYHNHNKLVHCSEDKRMSYTYICDICKEGFNRESHFYSHNIHVHSNEIVEVSLVDTTQKELKEKQHSNYLSDGQEKSRNVPTDQQKQAKPRSVYSCEICQVKCTDMINMKKHKEFHSNDGDFKCDKCNRQCKTFHLLDYHKRLTHLYHGINNKHLCHICGEVLETMIALKCHEKHFHSNNTDNNTDNSKNYDQILSSNITYKLLKYPYKSKTNTCNVTEYTCLFCDMKFSTVNNIQTHIVHVHMDDMIAKQTALKLALPINNNDFQKKFVETNPASSSSSSSSLSSSLSSDSTQLSQRSTLHQSGSITEIFELKKFKPIYLKDNKIIEKTPPNPATPCINKSKDISTLSTVAPNTESKADTSSTRSMPFRYVPITEFRSNTPSTISKTIGSNTKSKDNTSVPLSTSTNDLNGKNNEVSLKSGSNSEFKANSVSSNGSITINKSKTASVAPLTAHKVGPTLATPQSRQGKEITKQKPELVSNYESSATYSCPLCTIKYPGLMFFHAHLQYSHADSLHFTDELTMWDHIVRAQNSSMIQCLLCPLKFINESQYKRHLTMTHTYYVYTSNSEEINNPPTTQSNEDNTIIDNINKNSTIPETITVEDDDDDNVNVKNASNQLTTKVTDTLNHEKQNEKIGKLRVKPFAKIIENLSTDSALNL